MIQRKHTNKNLSQITSMLGLCLIIFFLSAQSVFALEVPLPGLASNPTIATYVAYFFGLGVSVTIFIAAIAFAIGGVGLMMSGDNKNLASESKDRMKGAIFGLALAAIAFLILNTASPTTTKPTLNPLPTPTSTNTIEPGVYFTDNSSDYLPAEKQTLTSDVPTKLNKIKYVCDSSGGQNIIVWEYQDTEWTTDMVDLRSSLISCNNYITIGSDTGAIVWDYEVPGAYLCADGCNSDNTCKGMISPVITTTQTPTPDGVRTFGGKAIRFVNDPKNNIYYSAVTEVDPGSLYSCGSPIIGKNNPTDCEAKDMKGNPVDADTDSVTLFAIDYKSPSKIGVNFYSDPYGWNTNPQGKLTAGIYSTNGSGCPPGDCRGSDGVCSAGSCSGATSSGSNSIGPILELNPQQMCYDYSHSIVATSGQFKCGVNHNNFCGALSNPTICSSHAIETVQDRIASLQINTAERYLVALYSGKVPNYPGTTTADPDLQYGFNCLVTKNTIPNLKAFINEDFSTHEYLDNTLSDIYIIPIK